MMAQNPTEITPAEFQAALKLVRAGELRITTVGELYRAVELGLINKSEARMRLGLTTRGVAAATQTRSGGRFAVIGAEDD